MQQTTILTKPDDELISLFCTLKSDEQVADFLEISITQLNFYRIQGAGQNKHYATFQIPKKSGGMREIVAPITPLKIIQSKLNQVLQLIYKHKAPVYGFVVKPEGFSYAKNIVTNAESHVGKKNLLNIDLEDFFPSIHFGRVMGLFMAWPFNMPQDVAIIIAQLACYNGYLPQGAPSSPVISNMICRKLDNDLMVLAKKARSTYTRYADDITFSTNTVAFHAGIVKQSNPLELGDELLEIIDSNKFKVNERKVYLAGRNQRQQVTGILVNKKANVSREYIKQVRAMLYCWKTKGLEAAEKIFLEKYNGKNKTAQEGIFKQVLWGRITFIGYVRGKEDKLYTDFVEQFTRLDPNYNKATRNFKRSGYKSMKENIEASLFINYADEDRNQVKGIHEFLLAEGFDPWAAFINIKGGEKWPIAIANAIKTKTFFVACLSTNAYDKRGYIQKEYREALEIAKAKLDSDIYLIPIKLDDCKIPDILSEYQAIDYFEDDGPQRLVDAIQEGIKRLAE